MAVPVLPGEGIMSGAVLVDSLVDVIDGLRDELHTAFGVRAYRAYRVIRSWTGARAGEGSFTDDVGELSPQPKVWAWDGLSYRLAACGLEELGDIVLTEVSLTYTEPQLTGRGILDERRDQLFIAIGEAHGQLQPVRLYTHARPPFVDRERDMGWKLWLRKVEGAPGVTWP